MHHFVLEKEIQSNSCFLKAQEGQKNHMEEGVYLSKVHTSTKLCNLQQRRGWNWPERD